MDNSCIRRRGTKRGSTNLVTRTRRIEEIRSGDYVWAWDEEAGALTHRRVKRLFRSSGRQVRELSCAAADGVAQSITATPEHPFWVEGKGWTALCKLEPGDLLKRIDAGAGIRVLSLEDTGRTEDVFNFEVEGMHNYFVGREGLLVHNASSRPQEEASFNLVGKGVRGKRALGDWQFLEKGVQPRGAHPESAGLLLQKSDSPGSDSNAHPGDVLDSRLWFEYMLHAGRPAGGNVALRWAIDANGDLSIVSPDSQSPAYATGRVGMGVEPDGIHYQFIDDDAGHNFKHAPDRLQLGIGAFRKLGIEFDEARVTSTSHDGRPLRDYFGEAITGHAQVRHVPTGSPASESRGVPRYLDVVPHPEGGFVAISSLSADLHERAVEAAQRGYLEAGTIVLADHKDSPLHGRSPEGHRARFQTEHLFYAMADEAGKALFEAGQASVRAIAFICDGARTGIPEAISSRLGTDVFSFVGDALLTYRPEQAPERGLAGGFWAHDGPESVRLIPADDGNPDGAEPRNLFTLADHPQYVSYAAPSFLPPLVPFIPRASGGIAFDMRNPRDYAILGAREGTGLHAGGPENDNYAKRGVVTLDDGATIRAGRSGDEKTFRPQRSRVAILWDNEDLDGLAELGHIHGVAETYAERKQHAVIVAHANEFTIASQYPVDGAALLTEKAFARNDGERRGFTLLACAPNSRTAQLALQSGKFSHAVTFPLVVKQLGSEFFGFVPAPEGMQTDYVHDMRHQLMIPEKYARRVHLPVLPGNERDVVLAGREAEPLMIDKMGVPVRTVAFGDLYQVRSRSGKSEELPIGHMSYWDMTDKLLRRYIKGHGSDFLETRPLYSWKPWGGIRPEVAIADAVDLAFHRTFDLPAPVSPIVVPVPREIGTDLDAEVDASFDRTFGAVSQRAPEPDAWLRRHPRLGEEGKKRPAASNHFSFTSAGTVSPFVLRSVHALVGFEDAAADFSVLYFTSQRGLLRAGYDMGLTDTRFLSERHEGTFKRVAAALQGAQHGYVLDAASVGSGMQDWP